MKTTLFAAVTEGFSVTNEASTPKNFDHEKFAKIKDDKKAIALLTKHFGAEIPAEDFYDGVPEYKAANKRIEQLLDKKLLKANEEEDEWFYTVESLNESRISGQSEITFSNVSGGFEIIPTQKGIKTRAAIGFKLSTYGSSDNGVQFVKKFDPVSTEPDALLDERSELIQKEQVILLAELKKAADAFEKSVDAIMKKAGYKKS